MRIRTVARLGGIAAGVLAMLGTFTPSASAEGIGAAAFIGTAKIAPGLCIPGGAPACPAPLPTPNTTPPIGKTNNFLTFGGATSGGTFAAGPCAGAGIENKTNKQPAMAGTCTITAGFTLTGFCGLSTGKGTGTFTLNNTLSTPPTAWTVTFTFTWIDPGGGNLIILGNYTKGTETGDIIGFVKATPSYTPTAIPPAIPPTLNPLPCIQKTATDFDIAGAALLTHPKALP